MRVFRVLTLFLVSSLLFVSVVPAQKKFESQHLLWTGYTLKLKVSEAYSLQQELQERVYWFPWRQHQFLTRTLLDRNLGKGWKMGIGFACMLQSLPHDPSLDFSNRTELRPQAQLSYRQTMSERLSIAHRYWSEFRFFEASNESIRFGNVRFRYKLEVNYAITRNLTFKAFDEIFINAGSQIVLNVFDQNRIGASMEYTPWENWAVELGYFNWFQQRSSGKDFYNRHIVRFTLQHTIDFSKTARE